MPRKIEATSSLMDNFLTGSHCTVKPGTATGVAQTTDGYSLFYFIGPDDQVHVAREKAHTETGWVQSSLSEPIAKQCFSGSSLEAMTLCVVQDHGDKGSYSVSTSCKPGPIRIAVVVRYKGHDHIAYTSMDPKTEITDTRWKLLPYSGDKTIKKIPTIIEDCLPGSPRFLVDVTFGDRDERHRFMVDPDGGGKSWKKADLGVDLDASKPVQVAFGRKDDDDAVVSLGEHIGRKVLNVSSWEEEYPQSTTLNIKDGHISSSLTGTHLNPESDTSDFFVISDKGAIFHFGEGDLDAGAVGTLCYANEAWLKNSSSIEVMVHGDQLTFWVVSGSEELFRLDCPRNEEKFKIGANWKISPPLALGVAGISVFNNHVDGAKGFFALGHGNELRRFQLVQADMSGGRWRDESIRIPEIEITKTTHIYSCTTRLVVTDTKGRVLPDEVIQLRAESPIKCYINNHYWELTEQYKSIRTDHSGALTVVEPVSDFAATPLFYKSKGVAPKRLDPNLPAQKKFLRLRDRKHVEDAKVYNDRGEIIGDLIDKGDGKKRHKFADLVGKIYESSKKRSSSQAYCNIEELSAREWTWAAGFENGNALKESSIEESVFNSTPVSWFSDAMRFLKGLLSAGKRFILEVYLDSRKFALFTIYHLGRVVKFVLPPWVSAGLVQLGKSIIEFFKVAAQAISEAAKHVWNFLKDLLNWADIERSKDIMKAIVRAGLKDQAKICREIKVPVGKAFDEAEERVHAYKKDCRDKLKPVSNRKRVAGADHILSAKANFLAPHVQLAVAKSASKGRATRFSEVFYEHDSVGAGSAGLSDQESKIYEATAKGIKDLCDRSWDPGDFVDLILDSIVSLLESSRHGVLEGIDFAEGRVDELMDLIDVNLSEFSLLSSILGAFGVKRLSVLDMACFMYAIPGTIVFKASNKGKSPFKGKLWDRFISGDWGEERSNKETKLNGFHLVREPVFFGLFSLYRLGLPKESMRDLYCVLIGASAVADVTARILDVFMIKAYIHKLGEFGWARFCGVISCVGASLEFFASQHFQFRLAGEKVGVWWHDLPNGMNILFGLVRACVSFFDLSDEAKENLFRWSIVTTAVVGLIKLARGVYEFSHMMRFIDDSLTRASFGWYVTKGICGGFSNIIRLWYANVPKPGVIALAWIIAAVGGISEATEALQLKSLPARSIGELDH